jgi:hypothetical protein
MRLIGFAAVLSFGAMGCLVGDEGGGTADPDPDPDPDPVERTCQLDPAMPDTGTLTAAIAQQCNVPGTQGAQHFYRVSAGVPTAPMDVLQIELWDGRGAFTGGLVVPGTYPITGAELSRDTCGICVRGLGGKGTADEMEYFATGGSVTVTTVTLGGGAFSAEVTGIDFGEIDATAGTPITTDQCTATVARSQIDGTLVVTGGGGGGGGGGACPTTIGD